VLCARLRVLDVGRGALADLLGHAPAHEPVDLSQVFSVRKDSICASIVLKHSRGKDKSHLLVFLEFLWFVGLLFCWVLGPL
jgi:hypothetical protein